LGHIGAAVNPAHGLKAAYGKSRGNFSVRLGCWVTFGSAEAMTDQTAPQGRLEREPVMPGTKAGRPALIPVHRAFASWLCDVVAGLAVGVRIEKQTPESIEMSFDGMNPAVGAIIKYDENDETDAFVELEVFVDWEGSNWDLILNLDCEPVRRADGYICDLCPPEDRKVFSSREALWRDHLFEPFLEWINEQLAQADVIGLSGSPGEGMTRATLLRSSAIPEDDPPGFCVPLRL
jgi:hypothetical protein